MLISCPFSHRIGIIKEVFLKTVTTFGAQDKKVCTDYFWWDRGIFPTQIVHWNQMGYIYLCAI